ncbi:sodium:solute symporter [Bacteroidales bacterium OttesenSCG-928-C19]|nr:sodium:solute symporter [Bacteroidales bacterium OttesenSCG-928-C19]
MAAIVLICFVCYTGLLFLITGITSRKANNETFFTGNRKSPWYIVAYGMIGASLSGVTFMSVPGYVESTQFTYFGVVLGYMIGYAVIAFILLPLYYKLNLVSIYSYLGKRFGVSSHKTGSAFFVISRLLGSALRMYLMVYVLYEFVFKGWGIPFWVPAVIFIVLILLYTFKGGIKTVVWTDTLQTTFMLAATILCFVFILKKLDLGAIELFQKATSDGYTKFFEIDWRANNFFVKQILSGAFITIAMTGLDQDMMQKNLTCKNLKDAQKNMLTFSFTLLIVNLLFLCLGAALLYYVSASPEFLALDNPDRLFPSVAFDLGTITSIFFIIGLIAAGYSSADGTLTALTTTICYDFLEFGEKSGLSENKKMRTRKLVHISCAVLYLVVIIAFRPFHNESLIKTLFDIAGFTYGPLLGLFTFGLISKRKVNDKYVPIIAILSPIICYIIRLNSEAWFWGYKFGFEILILNGLLTCLGLLLISKKSNSYETI